MAEPGSTLTEEEARRIWRRAAELQAEAAKRLEARSRALVDEADTPDDGYARTHVRQAAVEAGISPEFVDAALAEGAEGAGATSWARRLVEAGLTGSLPRAYEVSRVFDHPPDEVYRALQQLLPSGPYQLNLVDIEGPHPLEGGIMVFEVPNPSGLGGPRSEFLNDLRIWADMKSIRLRLRPVASEGRHSEVTVFASLDHTRKVNAWVGGSLLSIGGFLGGVVGVGVAGPLGLVAAPFVLVTGSSGWRWLSAWGVRKGRGAIERLLQAVSGHMRTGGAFAGGGALPPAPLEGGTEEDGRG